MKHYEKDVAAPRSTSKAGCAEDSDDSEAGREAVNKTAYQHGFKKFKRDRASSWNVIKYEDQKAELPRPMTRQPHPSITVASISTPEDTRPG